MNEMRTIEPISLLDSMIDDRPADGVFRLDRRMFTDPELFEAERRHVFEGGWVFLGLACQIPDAHDYFTLQIGRHPIVVMRDGQGALAAFINSCPHKGSRICQLAQGNTRLHVCPYHSWTFDSAGRNRDIKWKNAGAHAPAFDDLSHDLARLPAFAEHKGFLFGSVVADAPPLSAHLGEAARLLDLIVEESPQGIELVPGSVSFTYRGNWKLQLENASDAYHFTSTHPSYFKVLERRAAHPDGQTARSVWENDQPWSEGAAGVQGGSYSFDHGHVLNWGLIAPSPAHPMFDRVDELGERLGPGKRDWIFNMRNLTIFPNMQIVESAASQLRVIRPIAADMTEITTWCFAPVGEAAEARRQRIRSYEDFFNPTGMATPDDAACYENCQAGHASGLVGPLQGYSRGIAASKPGGNVFSDKLGMNPAASVLADSQLCDETLYHAYYRAWRARMAAGIAREGLA